eukprot:COSAG05_NODE_466_length_9533_cov_5.547806_3_plen_430_part_00
MWKQLCRNASSYRLDMAAVNTNPVFSQPAYRPEAYGDAYSGDQRVPLSCSTEHDTFSARKKRSSRHRGPQFQNSPRAARIKTVLDAAQHPEPFHDLWKHKRSHYARPASIAPRGPPFVAHESVKPLPWKGSESVYKSPGGQVVSIPTRDTEATSHYCSMGGPPNNARLKYGVGGISPRQMGVVCAPPKKGASGAAGSAGSLLMTFPNGQSLHESNDYGKQERLRDHMVAPTGQHRPNGEGTRGLGISPRRGAEHEKKGPFLRSIRSPQVLDPALIYEDASAMKAAEDQHAAVHAARQAVLAKRPAERFLTIAAPTVGAAFHQSKLQAAKENRPAKPGDDPYREPWDEMCLRADQESKSIEIAGAGKGVFSATYAPGKDFKTYAGTAAQSMGGERRKAVGMFHPSQKATPHSPRVRVGSKGWDLFNYRGS